MSSSIQDLEKSMAAELKAGEGLDQMIEEELQKAGDPAAPSESTSRSAPDQGALAAVLSKAEPPAVGKHRAIPARAFDAKQLAQGIKIELEHTNDRKVAEQIAKDHLAEIPDYYTRLQRMEAAAPKADVNKSADDVLGDWLCKAQQLGLFSGGGAKGAERLGHKYIKREGSPGKYEYTYPEEKKPETPAPKTAEPEAPKEPPYVPEPRKPVTRAEPGEIPVTRFTIGGEGTKSKQEAEHRAVMQALMYGKEAPEAKKEAPVDSEPRALEDDIPQSMAQAAFAATSHVPDERGAQIRKEYAEDIQQFEESLKPYVKDAESEAKVKAAVAEYREGLKKHYLGWLHAHSRVMSPMVTGPSKFPTERNRKRGDTADKRNQELVEWRKKFRGRAHQELSGRGPITADQPDAVVKLQQQLDAAEKRQAHMKAANKIIQSKASPDEQVAKLEALGLPTPLAMELLKPDFAGRLGYPSYELTNNNANIKRLRDRIQSITQEQARPTGDVEFSMPSGEKGTLVDNADENRVELHFEAKPSSAVIQQLKSSGFKWSPTKGVWQRLRNNAARYAAQQITGAKLAEPEMAKSLGDWLQKAEGEMSDLQKATGGEVAGHKYIERHGTPGSYTYVYAAQNRPVGYATVPKGYTKVDPHAEYRHGAVHYDRPLTEEETRAFELKPIASPEGIEHLAKQIASKIDYPKETLDLHKESPKHAEAMIGWAMDRMSAHVGSRAAFTEKVLDHLIDRHVADETAKQAANPQRRPEYIEHETPASYMDRLDAWKEQGDWVPASGGKEEPFTTRSGHRLQYVYQPRTGKHAYHDLGSDLILTDEEAQNILGKGLNMANLGDWLEKAQQLKLPGGAGGGSRPHKYLKREGSPGSYRYTYAESEHAPNHQQQAMEHNEAAKHYREQYSKIRHAEQAQGKNLISEMGPEAKHADHMAEHHELMANYHGMAHAGSEKAPQVKREADSALAAALAPPTARQLVDQEIEAKQAKLARKTKSGAKNRDKLQEEVRQLESGRAFLSLGKTKSGKEMPAPDEEVVKAAWDLESVPKFNLTPDEEKTATARAKMLDRRVQLHLEHHTTGWSDRDHHEASHANFMAADKTQDKSLARAHRALGHAHAFEASQLHQAAGLQKADLTPAKARKILHDGEVQGHPLTEQQRKYFGAVASGTARKAEGEPMKAKKRNKKPVEKGIITTPMAKSLEDWMQKAQGGGHKYIKREGAPGSYRYTYAESAHGENPVVGETSTGKPIFGPSAKHLHAAERAAQSKPNLLRPTEQEKEVAGEAWEHADAYAKLANRQNYTPQEHREAAELHDVLAFKHGDSGEDPKGRKGGGFNAHYAMGQEHARVANNAISGKSPKMGGTKPPHLIQESQMKKSEGMPTGDPGMISATGTMKPQEGANLEAVHGGNPPVDTNRSSRTSPDIGDVPRPQEKVLSEDDLIAAEAERLLAKPMEKACASVESAIEEARFNRDALLRKAQQQAYEATTETHTGPIDRPRTEAEPLQKSRTWTQGPDSRAIYTDRADRECFELLKGDQFYADGSTPGVLQKARLFQRDLCKSCNQAKPVYLTACPHCGDGSVQNRVTPPKNGGQILEKSQDGRTHFELAEEEPDLYLPAGVKLS